MVWSESSEAESADGENPDMTTMPCPYCGTVGHYEERLQESRSVDIASFKRGFRAYRCASCLNLCFLIWESFPGPKHRFRIYPAPAPTPQGHLSWPDRVSNSYVQAVNSLSTRSWDAAATMARRAIQAAVRAKGAKSSSIKAEIDELGKQGLLAPSLVEWSHEVRQLAAVGAHPDEEEPDVTEEDARDLVDFTRYVLTYLFTIPHEIQELRDRRQLARDPSGPVAESEPHSKGPPPAAGSASARIT